MPVRGVRKSSRTTDIHIQCAKQPRARARPLPSRRGVAARSRTPTLQAFPVGEPAPARRGSEAAMSSRARLVVLFISAPIVLLVVTGGFMSKATAARDETYRPIGVFQEVVRLILSNYVEPVNSDSIMRGAMHGLAEGLDPDSAYLTPAQVTAFASAGARAQGQRWPGADPPVLPAGDCRTRGLAGRARRIAHGRFRPRHRRQAHARDVGRAWLAAAPGTAGIEGVADRASRQRRRAAHRGTRPGGAAAAGRHQPDRAAGRRRSSACRCSDRRRRPRSASSSPAVRKQGAEQVLVDLRGTAEGPIDQGIAAARLFVGKGRARHA